jgi:putative ABC transport system ATP-binding protein
VGKPTLVIADEPTGNLDGMTAHEILQLIHRLNQDFQTTFVIATHDHRVMDMAHRVMTLSDGKSVL